MTEPLSTRYARTAEGAYLAYQVSGDGPMDLVLPITGSAGIELIWDEPAVSGFISRLASFSRLITFDPKGSAARVGWTWTRFQPSRHGRTTSAPSWKPLDPNGRLPLLGRGRRGDDVLCGHLPRTGVSLVLVNAYAR